MYAGGKNNNGSYQQIISEISLCDIFIEGFAGSMAVSRNMAMRSEKRFGIDVNYEILRFVLDLGYGRSELICADVMSMLPAMLDYYVGSKIVVYLDPPYLFDTRRSGSKGLYKHEFGTAGEHIRLLELVKSFPGVDWLISGYASGLYNSMLKGWRVKTWRVRTRAGVATEFLYMNFQSPVLLQDARYIGSNFTDRQRLRRLAGVEAR